MNHRDPHWWRTLDRKTLAQMLAEGHPIVPSALHNTVYKGISLGLPSVIEAVSWVVFAKTFEFDDHSQKLRGWNVRCEQTPLDQPVRYQHNRAGAPKTFGPYFVRAIEDSDPRPRPYQRGLMIDYSLDGAAGGVLGRTRDPIVAVQRGAFDVLLGWSFLTVGRGGISTPSYFALLRDRSLDHAGFVNS